MAEMTATYMEIEDANEIKLHKPVQVKSKFTNFLKDHPQVYFQCP